MKALNLIILALCAYCVLGLKTLKKEEIQNKYEIGSISDLYFRIEEKIFFRSDDDIFGFIDQKDGSLKEVYELEPDQEILKFVRSYEIIISKNKSLNIFLAPHSVYKSITPINTYLNNHTDYSKIVDFLRTGNLFVYVLTDKFLLQIQFSHQKKQYRDNILVQLKNQSQEFEGLVPFLNVALGKQDIYLVSTLKDTNTSKVCFRKVSSIKADAICFQISKDDIIVDIVDSSDYIYIQFQNYALSFANDLRFIGKIDSKPLHYFNGLVSLSSAHTFYDPAALNTTYNTIIVAEHQSIFRTVMTLKIQQKSIILQDKNKEGFIDILSITKDVNENPRKAWGYAKKDNAKEYRLYVEFSDGKLVCYSIDRKQKKYEQVWRITTIKANKIVTGQKEAVDIQDESDEDINQQPKP